MNRRGADEKRAATLRREDAALLKRLGSRNDRVSREAEQEIRDRGDAGIALLSVCIDREAKRTLYRRIAWGSLWMAVMIAFSHVLSNAGAPYWVQLLETTVLTTLGVHANSSLGFMRRQRRAVLLLAEAEDVQAVGPLLDILACPDRSLRIAAARALTRLLPRLQVQDIPLLARRHWRQMNDILVLPSSAQHNVGLDADFHVALLKAVATIGNAGYLPNVKDLAAGIGVAAVEPAVRAAAKECVPILVERSEESSSKTLLRASAPGSHILLRPAGPRR